MDVKGYPLRLAQKLLRPLNRLLKLLKRRVREAGKIARLIDQHLSFVLKLSDLLIHLLEGPRRSEDVLGIVRWVVDDPLSGSRGAEDR